MPQAGDFNLQIEGSGPNKQVMNARIYIAQQQARVEYFNNVAGAVVVAVGFLGALNLIQLDTKAYIVVMLSVAPLLAGLVIGQFFHMLAQRAAKEAALWQAHLENYEKETSQ